MTSNTSTYKLTSRGHKGLLTRGYDLTCTICHNPILPTQQLHRNGRNQRYKQTRYHKNKAKYKHEACYRSQFI